MRNLLLLVGLLVSLQLNAVELDYVYIHGGCSVLHDYGHISIDITDPDKHPDVIHAIEDAMESFGFAPGKAEGLYEFRKLYELRNEKHYCYFKWVGLETTNLLLLPYNQGGRTLSESVRIPRIWNKMDFVTELTVQFEKRELLNVAHIHITNETDKEIWRMPGYYRDI